MPQSDNLSIEIKTKPNSIQFSIKPTNPLTVYCKSPAEKGKANAEIVKELKEIFKTEVKIISGLKSKNKKLLLKNITKKEFIERLEKWKK